MTLCSLAAVVLVAALTAPASAATVYSAEFNTPGDTEGWTPWNLTGAGLTADGDSLNGLAPTGVAGQNDPQIRISDVSISKTDGAFWESIVFRVRETQNETPAGVVSAFDTLGLNVQFQLGVGGGVPVVTMGDRDRFSAVPSGEGFFTVTVDLSPALPTVDFGPTFTGAEINALRIDPIGGAGGSTNSQTNGNSFEIDFIRITETPPARAARAPQRLPVLAPEVGVGVAGAVEADCATLGDLRQRR